MVAEIGPALKGLEVIFSKLGKAISAKYRSEFYEQLAVIQQTNTDLQKENSSLVDANRELEERLRQLERWRVDEDMYQVTQVAKGIFAYTRRQSTGEEHTSFQEMVKFCTNCFHQQKESILQHRAIPAGRKMQLVCDTCGPGQVFHSYTPLATS